MHLQKANSITVIYDPLETTYFHIIFVDEALIEPGFHKTITSMFSN